MELIVSGEDTYISRYLQHKQITPHTLTAVRAEHPSLMGEVLMETDSLEVGQCGERRMMGTALSRSAGVTSGGGEPLRSRTPDLPWGTRKRLGIKVLG